MKTETASGSKQEDDTFQGKKIRLSSPPATGGIRIAEACCYLVSILLIIAFFPVSMFLTLQIVKQYEKGVLLRFGKFHGTRGPGLICIIPCIDSLRKIELRTVSYDVPPQEVLTKDSCTVSVDAVTYYCVRDPVMAVLQVVDYNYATCLLAATTLRNIMGQKNLTEILSERESIAILITSVLDEATDPWGVWVERVEIKDVRLPEQMQRAMAAEAEATREARAKIIAAEGELNASKNLKEASDVIAKNPTALQLRYLQTLHSIATEKSSTIVFPLPVDLITAFGQ